jgi:hypothetical protein
VLLKGLDFRHVSLGISGGSCPLVNFSHLTTVLLGLASAGRSSGGAAGFISNLARQIRGLSFSSDSAGLLRQCCLKYLRPPAKSFRP